MEEILRELIKSTAENGPQKQFYSNLKITEPFQKHVEISTRISKGISFLEKVLDSKTGFQSRAYKSRNCKELISNDSKTLHEIYTSLIALSLFGDGELCEIEFSDESLKLLRDLILPECAITTLNIFKTSFLEWGENDSKDEICPQVENIIADDCNTTSLVVSILFRDGILDHKPARSIGQFLFSNVPDLNISFENSDDKFPDVIHTFLDGNTKNGPELDPITCANVLYLYYQTETNLNYKKNVESTEIFLVETLKSLLTLDDEEKFSATVALHNSPDALLYFLSRVTSISQHARNRFKNLLIGLLDKRISKTSEVLDISMRILSANELGLLTNDNVTIRRKIIKDYETLARLQNNIDGSWPADSLFKIRINETDVFYGGREVSTIFACKALDVYYKSMKAVKIKTRLYNNFMY